MDADVATVDRFAAALRQQRYAEATVLGYVHDVSVFTAWLRETRPAVRPEAVTREDVQAYVIYLSRDGLRPGTIKRRLTALRAWFRWASAQGWGDDLSPYIRFESRPCGIVPIPQGRAKGDGGQSLAVPEQHALLARMSRVTAHNQQQDMTLAGIRRARRNRAVISLLLYAGLRVSELVALTLDDLELSEYEGRVTVRKGEGYWYREVPLNAAARRALQDYLAVRPTRDGDNWLFPGRGQGHICRQTVHDVVAQCAFHAGLRGVTPLMLRRTCAQNLLDAGMTPAQVAQMMG